MLALFLGWSNSSTGNVSNSGQPTPTNPAPPFHSLPKGWMVTVLFHSSAPPDIQSVSQIEQLRIPPENNTGEYSIRLLTSDSKELYFQNFQVYFLRAGVSGKLDSVEKIILLPYIDGAVKIEITTPFGEKLYEIPQ